jgi:hypothetical protein
VPFANAASFENSVSFPNDLSFANAFSSVNNAANFSVSAVSLAHFLLLLK